MQRLSPYLVPAGNLALRAVAMGARLLLALYLAKFVGVAEVGVFGLIQGAANMLPIVLGWGVTYFLGRELVGQEPFAAGRMVRDRLLLTVASLAVGGVIVAVVVWSGALSSTEHLALIIFIVCLEAVAFDIHIALISLGKPLLANALLFVRSGAWVFPVVGFGIVVPSLRTLDFVLWLWSAALIVNFIGLFLVLKAWPLRAIAQTPVDRSWITSKVRGGWLIYINDLGLVGSTYLDRYIVDGFLSTLSTGVFVFYWSIANAVHVLVSAAVIQVSLPKLVQAYRDEGEAAWRQAMRAETIKVAAVGLPLAIVTYAAAMLLIPLTGIADLTLQPLLFAMMLVATVIRLISDILSFGLYSRGLDREHALINVAGVFVSVALSVALIQVFGLLGVGVSMIGAATFSLLARSFVLIRAQPSGAAIRPPATA